MHVSTQSSTINFSAPITSNSSQSQMQSQSAADTRNGPTQSDTTTQPKIEPMSECDTEDEVNSLYDEVNDKFHMIYYWCVVCVICGSVRVHTVQ